MEQPVIYILTNRNNGKRYVGLARKSFAGRLRSHLKNNSYIGRALRKYGVEGFDIQQINYSADLLNYWEKYWIKELNTKHPNGYNLTDGGDGLVNPSQEVRDRIAAKVRELDKPESFTFKGHSHSEESRKKLSESLKVALNLPEVKERLSIAHKGRIFTEEQKKKISNAKLGIKRTDTDKFSERMKIVTSKEDYVNPMFGKKRSDLAERNRLGKGRKDSEETRARKSAASKGKPKSPEHVRKIKEAKLRNKQLKQQQAA